MRLCLEKGDATETAKRFLFYLFFGSVVLLRFTSFTFVLEAFVAEFTVYQ